MFHGTAIHCASQIGNQGPNFKLLGSRHGLRLGPGFYASDNLEVAIRHAYEGAIVVCDALPGIVKFEQHHASEFSSLLQQGCHSVLDTKQQERVFFHPDAVLPTYIISLSDNREWRRHLEEEQQVLLEKLQAARGANLRRQQQVCPD